MTEEKKSKVKEEFKKALKEMENKENVSAFIFLTMDETDGETAKEQCIVSGSLLHLAKLYNSVDKNVKTTAAIAVNCMKSGVKDPEIISDLEKTIHKAELQELFIEECRKGLFNENSENRKRKN